MNKKISMLGGAMALALVLAGCAKDYTCECTESTDGFSYKYTKTIKGATKGQAKTNCISTTEVDEDGDKWETTCELK